ncbi:hypothetical protein BH09CHL1_BH09CHL1_21670 [soil metagenome]
MTWANFLQYAVFIAIVTLLVRPIGGYLARVFNGERTLLDPILKPVERRIYRIAGVDPDDDMDWERYGWAFLLFALVGTFALFLILMFQ